MLYNSWDDIQVSMGSRGVNSLVGTYNQGSSRAPTTLAIDVVSSWGDRSGDSLIHRVRSDDVVSSWGDRSGDSLIHDVGGLYSDDVVSVTSSDDGATMLTP